MGPVTHSGNMLIPMGAGANAAEVAADYMAAPQFRAAPPAGATANGSFLWFDRGPCGQLRVWTIPVRDAVWRQGRKILQRRRLLAAQARYAPEILRRAVETEQIRREAEARIGALRLAEARVEFEAMLAESARLERRVLQLQEEINATLSKLERRLAEGAAGETLDNLQRAIDLAVATGQLTQMGRGQLRASSGQVADLSPYAGQWTGWLRENSAALRLDLEATSRRIESERSAFEAQVQRFREAFGPPIRGPY